MLSYFPKTSPGLCVLRKKRLNSRLSLSPSAFEMPTVCPEPIQRVGVSDISLTERFGSQQFHPTSNVHLAKMTFSFFSEKNLIIPTKVKFLEQQKEACLQVHL